MIYGRRKIMCAVMAVILLITAFPEISLAHMSNFSPGVDVYDEDEKAGTVDTAQKGKKAPILTYRIPQHILDENPTFAAVMKAVEPCIGIPYVWGESSPEKGFDCSGLISYVFNKSGKYRFKRRGANGLYNMCQKIERGEEKPGDLIFFMEKKNGHEEIVHCGIYIGNGFMIHAGNPVKYEDITTKKWQNKMLSKCPFGRMPTGKYQKDYQ